MRWMTRRAPSARPCRAGEFTHAHADAAGVGSVGAETASATDSARAAVQEPHDEAVTPGGGGGGGDEALLAAAAAKAAKAKESSAAAVVSGQVVDTRQCDGSSNTELWGDVVVAGDRNAAATAGECCRQCAATTGCNVWVHCAAGACAGRGLPDVAQAVPQHILISQYGILRRGQQTLGGPGLGQCWLKHQDDPAHPQQRAAGEGIPWTSGAHLKVGRCTFKPALKAPGRGASN